MSLQLNRGFRNHLMRRVRRHSALATLFQAPSSPETENLMAGYEQTPAVSDTPANIVQATWSGAGNAIPEMPIALPSAQSGAQDDSRFLGTVQAQQATPALSGPVEDNHPSRVAPVQVQPARASGTPAIAVQNSPSRTPVPSQAVPVPAARTPEADTESGITDSVWHRLQTIFKRHQNPPDTARTSDNTQQSLTTEEIVIHQGEPPSAQQNASVPSLENTAQNETRSTSQTPPMTHSMPGSPANIQRSPQIGSEPVSQQMPGEPALPAGHASKNAIHTVADDTVSRSMSENVENSTRTPAYPVTGLAGETLTSTADQPKVQPAEDQQSIQNSITTGGVPYSPSAPAIEPSTTDNVRTQSGQTTRIEQTPIITPDRLAHTPMGELTQKRQAEGPTAREHVSSPVTQQSPSTSRIQRVKASADTLESPSSPQPVVKAVDLPETPDRNEDMINAFGTIPEDVMENQQPIPLQEAWHVERLTSRIPTPERLNTPDMMSQDFAHPGENSYDLRTQESVSRVLNNVATGRPTTSSIEVVAPRRPRPVPVRTAGQGQRATLMREMAPVPEQQHIAVRTQEDRQPDSDGVVDTAIGPLPADLWTLIDEPVPPSVRRQSDSSRETSSHDSRESTHAVTQIHSTRQEIPGAIPTNHDISDVGARISRRQERRTANPILQGEPQHPVIVPAPVLFPPQSSRIQRVAEQYGDDTQSSSEEQSQTTSLGETSAGQEQQPEESQVDIDDLAQKVYGEVKRRLSVEWERLRTRF